MTDLDLERDVDSLRQRLGVLEDTVWLLLRALERYAAPLSRELIFGPSGQIESKP